MVGKGQYSYPDDFEWSISFHFTSDGEMFPVSDGKRRTNVVYSDSPIIRTEISFHDYTRFTSYQIHDCNGDNSIHGDWNEDGFLVCNGEWLMKNELYTPDQLVLLMPNSQLTVSGFPKYLPVYIRQRNIRKGCGGVGLRAKWKAV